MVVSVPSIGTVIGPYVFELRGSQWIEEFRAFAQILLEVGSSQRCQKRFVIEFAPCLGGPVRATSSFPNQKCTASRLLWISCEKGAEGRSVPAKARLQQRDPKQ